MKVLESFMIIILKIFQLVSPITATTATNCNSSEDSLSKSENITTWKLPSNSTGPKTKSPPLTSF